MRSESKIATNCFPLSLCLSRRETKFLSRGGLQLNVYVLNELFRRDGRIAACSVVCQYWLRMTAELFLRHLGPFMCGACFSSLILKLSSVVTFNGEAWITACPVVTSYWLRMTAELCLRFLGQAMCGACFSAFTFKLSRFVAFNLEMPLN